MNNNIETRRIIKENRLYFYEVAEKLGITENTLYRWLRKELDDEKRELVLNAVKALTEGK